MTKTIKCTIGSFFTGKCNDKSEKPRGVLLECEGRDLIIKDGEEVSSEQFAILIDDVATLSDLNKTHAKAQKIFSEFNEKFEELILRCADDFVSRQKNNN